jgi:membrane protease YdiL (CAAX protease family)
VVTALVETQTTIRRRVVLYCGAATLAFWALMVSFRLGFHPAEKVAVTLVMWIPGLLSMLWRLAFREGFADVGWRAGKARYWVWAYVLPLVFGVVSYVLALVFHRVAIAPSLAAQPMLDVVYFKLRWFASEVSTPALLAQRLLTVALIGMVPSFFLALGEELGWRGYLLQRLVRTGWRRPVFLAGVVWAVWHLPLLLMTGYGHGVPSVILHTVLILFFGVFVAWLRLASGSVWVAAMAHASFNGFVQCFLGPSFVGQDTWVWVGDYGVFMLVPYGLLTVWLYGSKRVRDALPREQKRRARRKATEELIEARPGR